MGVKVLVEFVGGLALAGCIRLNDEVVVVYRGSDSTVDSRVWVC